VVAFVAGSHGRVLVDRRDAAAHRAHRRDEARGTVIVAPLLNVASFEAMTRTSTRSTAKG
jgi:predicted deacylase